MTGCLIVKTELGERSKVVSASQIWSNPNLWFLFHKTCLKVAIVKSKNTRDVPQKESKPKIAWMLNFLSWKSAQITSWSLFVRRKSTCSAQKSLITRPIEGPCQFLISTVDVQSVIWSWRLGSMDVEEISEVTHCIKMTDMIQQSSHIHTGTIMLTSQSKSSKISSEEQWVMQKELNAINIRSVCPMGVHKQSRISRANAAWLSSKKW